VTARRGASERRVATFALPVDGPLSLEHTLESGQAFRWKREGDWRCGLVGQRLLHLRQMRGGLRVRCVRGDEEGAARAVRSYLRLDDDLEAIYERIAVDDHMRRAIARFRGMRLVDQDPWECLLTFVCSPASNIPRIRLTVERIAARFGERVRLGDETRAAFPTPERMRGATERVFRGLGGGFRSRYLARIVEMANAGGLELAPLREAPYPDARKALEALPGVGPKVADCVLAFSLNRMEAYPVDLHIYRETCETYGEHFTAYAGRASVPYDAMGAWARAYFRGYAGYAQQYLFHGRRMG